MKLNIIEPLPKKAQTMSFKQFVKALSSVKYPIKQLDKKKIKNKMKGHYFYGK